MKTIYTVVLFLFVLLSQAQITDSPLSIDSRLNDIIQEVSAERIESSIRTLANFGTRHTLSDTISETRGIGAARRWIYGEFEQINRSCNNCLEVSYHRNIVEADESPRIPVRTEIVNVLAILRGTKYPDSYVLMAGDIDSRISDILDYSSDNPGANDNASGMAGVIEAARVLSKYQFESSIIFVGLSGEEQGLWGGKFLAATAQEKSWDIIGILNNDMIGNIEGIDGVIDNQTFRIFSEATPPNPTEQKLVWNRFYGGEVDGPSRQLARYIHRLCEQYLPQLNPMMVYRLDRFGRGGHHKPFNDAGFPGVRIMEAHEHYDRQHQDIRIENGVEYGDVIEGVNFDYAASLTTVNAIALASLAWAPQAPQQVMIGGAVQPSTRLKWEYDNTDKETIGFKIYWRPTTSPQWEHSRFVGLVDDYTLDNIVIDNYLFGVAAIDKDGHESIISYPTTLIPRGIPQNRSK